MDTAIGDERMGAVLAARNAERCGVFSKGSESFFDFVKLNSKLAVLETSHRLGADKGSSQFKIEKHCVRLGMRSHGKHSRSAAVALSCAELRA